MTRQTHNKPFVGLFITTALASAALSGCTTNAAPPAQVSAGKAQVALEKGSYDKAIALAEEAVLAEPRNAGYRALMGAAYLEAGRFQSAATSFNDAIALGDNDPRTVLSYALAETALGNQSAAIAVLDDWQDDIDPADLGLALALAGDPDRGVHVLGNVLRAGNVTAKVRQNLAYAYALQGNWRAARLMAAEDVPADQLDARISEWAQMAKPEDYQTRVAGLLQVRAVADAGQPQHLALANHPSAEQMVAEAAAYVPQPEAQPQAVAFVEDSGELAPLAPYNAAPVSYPAVARVEPDVAAPATFAEAFVAPVPSGATPAQIVSAAARFVGEPAVQKLPARYGAEAAPRVVAPASSRVATKSSQGRMLAAADGSDTHLVQLGSFSSRQGARRAWGIYVKRYPQLDGHDMVITEANVRGKTYYRVSAAGFGSSGASSMCGAVKSSGHGCFAYAEGRPLPGAVDRGVRMASR